MLRIWLISKLANGTQPFGRPISKLAPMLRIWLISKLANGTHSYGKMNCGSELELRKNNGMRNYMGGDKIYVKENSQFANWLLTTFANFRLWPLAFYKFLVYVFIC